MNVKAGNGFDFLLEVVQAEDRASLFGEFCPDRREKHDMLDSGLRDGFYVRVRNLGFVAKDVVRLRVAGQQQVNGVGALERSGHRRRVVHLGDKWLGAFLRKRREVLGISPDRAHFLIRSQKRFRSGLARVSCCACDDDHDFASCDFDAAMT